MEKRWVPQGSRLPPLGSATGWTRPLHTHYQPVVGLSVSHLSPYNARLGPIKKISCSEPEEKTPRALTLRGLRDWPHLRNLL